MGHAGYKPRGKRRCSVLIREHAYAPQTELTEQIAESQPPTHELHLPETTESSCIIALVGMKPREHRVGDRIRAWRKVHPG